MRHKLAATIGAVALAATMLAAPVASLAANGTTHLTYKTTLTETGIAPSAIPYEGSLQLTVSSDGLVSGWYRPTDSGPFIPVTGGWTKGRLWLNVGERGLLQISADVKNDGHLVGSAVQLPASYPGTIGATDFPRTFDFVASPSA